MENIKMASTSLVICAYVFALVNMNEAWNYDRYDYPIYETTGSTEPPTEVTNSTSWPSTNTDVPFTPEITWTNTSPEPWTNTTSPKSTNTTFLSWNYDRYDYPIYETTSSPESSSSKQKTSTYWNNTTPSYWTNTTSPYWTNTTLSSWTNTTPSSRTSTTTKPPQKFYNFLISNNTNVNFIIY